MVGMDGKYKFSWQTAVYLIICVVGVVGLLLLIRTASNEAANYDQSHSKNKTEQKATSDILIGGTKDKPQEAGETNSREENKRQMYEQMRQTISPEVIE